MFPSMEGCSVKWSGQKLEELNEVFYNQIVSSYYMVDKKEFESDNFEFSFACKNNPITRKKIEQTFGKAEFKPVPASSGIFKLAARFAIKKEEESEKREKISLKYQVLAPETAMVGVMQEEGELESVIELYDSPGTSGASDME